MKYQFEWEEIKFCVDCPCCEQELGKNPLCLQNHKYIEHNYIYRQPKPNWCPLVEVQDE